MNFLFHQFDLRHFQGKRGGALLSLRAETPYVYAVDHAFHVVAVRAELRAPEADVDIPSEEEFFLKTFGVDRGGIGKAQAFPSSGQFPVDRCSQQVEFLDELFSCLHDRAAVADELFVPDVQQRREFLVFLREFQEVVSLQERLVVADQVGRIDPVQLAEFLVDEAAPLLRAALDDL